MGPKVGDFKSSIYTRSTVLIKSRFTKLKAIVDELYSQSRPLTPVQLKQLNTHSKEIHKKKAEFENNLQRALSLEDESLSDDTLSQDQDEIEELFSHITATIEVLLPPETSSSPSVVIEASTLSQPLAPQVRLPKLDLQKFSGDPLTWTSFINLFDTTIHHNDSLSSVIKFQYLLSVLSGEPHNLVKGLNLTEGNYFVAYTLLRDRYHNSRRLQSLHLNQLLDLPNVTAFSLKGLRHFVNLFTEHSQALKALDCDVTDNNPLLSALLLRKLDPDLRKKLESFRAISADEPPTHTLPAVNDIIKFLNTECSQTEDANIHSSPHPSKGACSSLHPHQKVTMPTSNFCSSDVTMVTAQTSHTQPHQSSQIKNKSPLWQCFVCNSNGHKIYSCSVFKNKSPYERHQLVKQHFRCISCLGNHNLQDCQSQSICHTCNKRHHTLLHFPISQYNHGTYSALQKVDKNSQRPTQVKTDDSNEETSHSPVTLTSQIHPPFSEKCSTVLLGTLLVKLTSSQGTTHVFRALLDSGSMCDLITERAAQLLGACRFKSDIQLTGISQNATKNKGQAYLNIETLSGLLISPQHPMLILDNLTVNLPRVPVSPEVFERTNHYCLADPSFHLPGPIDVVLGGSLFPKLLTHEHFSLGQHMPHVVGTHFGYVVMGTAPCEYPTSSNSHSMNSPSHHISLHSSSDIDLHTPLQRFWTQDRLRCMKKTEEGELCDASFRSTHSRDQDGRYTFGLPFKDAHSPLGASQPPTEARFYPLERNYAVRPQFSSHLPAPQSPGAQALVSPLSMPLPQLSTLEQPAAPVIIYAPTAPPYCIPARITKLQP